MSYKDLKRVPLDFAWPLYQAWEGFVNQYEGASRVCLACNGECRSPKAIHLKDLWYGTARFKPEDRGSVPYTIHSAEILEKARNNLTRSPEHYGIGETALEEEARRLCHLLNSCWQNHLNAADVQTLWEEGRLWRITHHSTSEGWVEKTPKVIPTPEMVNSAFLLSGGHDLTNEVLCIQAECERLGEPFYCSSCKGQGVLWESPEAEALAEAWEPTEPPEGVGYQMWDYESPDTAFPCTQVFASADELAIWLANNYAAPPR